MGRSFPRARRKGADERDEATADSYGFIVASKARSFGVAGRAGVTALVRPLDFFLLAADQSRTRDRSQGRSDASANDRYLVALAQAHGADAIVSDRHTLEVAPSELQVLAPRAPADCLGPASGG
jgi:predicted nucleic acid-binding protein